MENVFDGWIQTLPKRHLSPWTVCWNATVVLVPYRFVVCVLAVCWVECYALFFNFYFLHWFPCPFTKKKMLFAVDSSTEREWIPRESIHDSTIFIEIYRLQNFFFYYYYYSFLLKESAIGRRKRWPAITERERELLRETV